MIESFIIEQAKTPSGELFLFLLIFGIPFTIGTIIWAIKNIKK